MLPKNTLSIGLKIAVIFALMLTTLALLGYLWEHMAVVVETAIAFTKKAGWLITIGGTFWRSIAAGTVYMFVTTWGLVVLHKYADLSLNSDVTVVTIFGAGAFACWMVSLFVMYSVVPDTKTTYESLAYAFMHLPIVASVIVFIGALFWVILNEADTKKEV